MVVAGALVEISGEFYYKLFIRLLKTEEATASSASMLATPLSIRELNLDVTENGSSFTVSLLFGSMFSNVSKFSL